jgi:diguanylate cyclase
MARHTRSVGPTPVTESARLRVGRRIAVTVLIGSVAAFVAFLPWSNTDADSQIRSLVLLNLAHLATAYLCWRPREGDPRTWRLLATAILLSTAGSVCFALVPDATLGDVLYLSSYVFLCVAAVRAVRERTHHIVPAVWLDGLVIGLGVAAVAAASVLAPLLHLQQAQSVIGLAYPVADLTLLIVLVTLAGATRLRLDPRLALLGSGFGFVLVTDLAYLLLGSTRSYHGGALVDLGLLPALLPLAAAACLGMSTRQADTEPQKPISGPAIAAPTLAGLAALAVLMTGYRLALPALAGALAGACLLVALLRAALTLHQLRALPEARREARTDPLTDLANRRHLHERCAHLLARPDTTPVTVLLIDLDDFKVVNDLYGHAVGDALLVRVATRFAAVMRRDDVLGRLGGDEFAAVLPRTTPSQARMLAQRMHAVLAEPIVVNGRAFRIGSSIGISAAGESDTSTAALFQQADTAMYWAKKTQAGTADTERAWARRNQFPHRDDLARRRA